MVSGESSVATTTRARGLFSGRPGGSWSSCVTSTHPGGATPSIERRCSTQRWPGSTTWLRWPPARSSLTTGWPRALRPSGGGKRSWTGANDSAAGITTASRPSCAIWPTRIGPGRGPTGVGRAPSRSAPTSAAPRRSRCATASRPSSTGLWPCARPTWPPVCARSCARWSPNTKQPRWQPASSTSSTSCCARAI